MDVVGYLDLPMLLLTYVKAGFIKNVIEINGTLSVPRLLITLGLGLLVFGLFQQRRARRVRLAVLLRAVFPQKIFGSSSRADVLMTMLNMFVIAAVFSWAFLSQHAVSKFVVDGLTANGGLQSPTTLSPWVTGGILTVGLFLAYEFAYWLDHYLCHRVPFLWEFHKVHHTAEVLTPLTNFRVHPMDTIVFYNMLALSMGVMEGVLKYGFGQSIQPFTVWNTNILLLAGAVLLEQLQHTNFWIPFTGVWGKIFLSPAHHQIHHSTNPVHFNKNMGGNLSVFDWLFGTLHIPAKQREKLTFGVTDAGPMAHRAEGLLVTPVIDALGHLHPARSGKLDVARNLDNTSNVTPLTAG
jgi:sterol desaturase/sphingolipid hydroxylase (fatty acid hydroxylase superfamily)